MARILHKEITDEEVYNNLKKIYKKNQESLMSPKEWKRKRLIELKRIGKVWSK